MDIEGTYTFQAPIEHVWKTLLDPEALAHCLPGVENMRTVGPDAYEASIRVGVGPVKYTMSGKVSVMDKQEPAHYRLTADGSGAQGFVKAEGTIDLAQQNGNTIATYKGSAQLGGAIAGVGMRMLSGAAKGLINQFFGNVAQVLRAEEQPAAAAAAAAPAKASATPAGQKAASKTETATRSQSSAPQPAITRPVAEQPGFLIQLVRLLKVSDGSQEDEERWAQRLLLGGVGLVLAIALLGFMIGRLSQRKS